LAELGKTTGIVFQNPALQLHQLRVIDEVASAPMYQGLPYKTCQKRAIHLVTKMLGKSFFNRSPSELSAGQQQRVALAASLSLNANILLLDEPLSFLDTKADQEILEIILALHRKGKTIIVATHDIEEIATYVTHMALLNKGELILQGHPKKVLYSQKLEKILTAPLSIRAAKALIKNKKLKHKVLSWQELTNKVKFKKKPKKKTTKTKKPILTLENISFHYPETRTGVKNINLQIYKNEILGIIGANGSGKTTLAKIILGLLKPSKGKVKLAREDITKMPTPNRAKKIGYVTQDPLDMFFETNIWDECAAGPKFLELPEPKGQAMTTLKRFNLWKYKHRHPDSVSGGEKSLLGIADILVNDPEILLLDEPEFGLDPKNWRKIVDTLRQLKNAGKTIVVITQDLEIATFLCDRIALMNKGKILATGAPKQIFTNHSLLKKAGLVVLPLFNLLDSTSDTALDSEEKFIKELTE